MKLKNPILLLILDGWGIAPSWGANAIGQAYTPNFDRLWRDYPHSTLEASGENVGLPGHEQGNSEVGHLNIGAGRIVYQDSSRITKAISDGSFFDNQELLAAIDHAKKNNSNLHLIGLMSTGIIHAHINHLFALLDLCKKQNFDRVYIDLFTDGRDTLQMSGLELLSKVENKIEEIKLGKINSFIGRFYAMDRDNHWERIRRAYNLLVLGEGFDARTPAAGIAQAYKAGMTDEYIEPTKINNFVPIKDNDAVIFYNFRSDRARELTKAFTASHFDNFERKKINNLFFVSMIPYGIEKEVSNGVHSAFQPENLKNTLAESLADQGFSQFHIAETEKYAHVTYFFNGGQEKNLLNEERKLINSPRVATYDLKPEMSVQKIVSEVVNKIRIRKFDFILANFANADMVGHTGNFKATVEAIESIDSNLKIIVDAVKEYGVTLLITADHGNAEEMINPKTGEVSTKHSSNSVPLILLQPEKFNYYQLEPRGILADIAPTILDLMNLKKPNEMTGKSLIINKKQ